MQPIALSIIFGIAACIIGIVAGYPFIRLLGRLGVGTRIRAEGPANHAEKVGTPTMGGLLVCISVLVTTIGTVLVQQDGLRHAILLPLGVLVSCAVLGMIDDIQTLCGRKGAGLSARAKLAGLSLIGGVSAVILWHPDLLGIDFVFIPSVREPFPVPAWLYLPFATFVIVASANAVNLTDGVDSLAGWTVLIAFATYALIAHLYGQHDVTSFCLTFVGALCAFLWFNAYPAQVFMGDTGSLALGATLAVVALMVGQAALLPIVGLIFVVETVSVVLQVASFKLTHGRRLFRMAPLHHHFELIGWKETLVTQRFVLVSILAAMLAVALSQI